MADRDVLICGTCSTQFSDLKIFIDHKQTCGYAATSIPNSVDTSTIITTPQQTSPIGSQQIVLPTTGHASIVSLPVGMPHVILQTSLGQSQMYRIVLEPSLNTTNQPQTNQMYNSIHPSNNGIETQYAVAIEDKTLMRKDASYVPDKLHMNENGKETSLQPSNLSLSEASMTRLTAMDPIDSVWTQQRTDHHQASDAAFQSMESSVVPVSEKGILDPLSGASSLHTEEEDVATFLATQLVSQTTAPSQHSKCKENLLKYCNITHESTIPVQDVTMNIPSKAEEFPMQDKNAASFLPPENKIENNQISTKDSSEFQIKEGIEVVEKGTKKFICPYDNCKFFTPHKKDMVRHIRKHTGEKPFECPECRTKFSRMDKLKVHKRTHSKERPHACPEPGCSYRGNEKAHLRKHLRTHTDERPYRCQFCPYGAKDGSHLTVHLRSHTGDTPFHCQFQGCPATFRTSSDLKRHEKLHTGEKPFKCSECDYTSALKANLKVHFRNNHFKGEKYACNTCAFLATSRKQFKEHERAHRGHLIRNSKKVDSLTPLMNSGFPPNGKQELQHPRPLVESAGKRSAFPKRKRDSKPSCLKNYKCEKCGSGFVREDSYRSHVRQHEQKGREADRGLYGSLPSIPGAAILSTKGKAKPVYTLNYVLQDEATHSLTKEIIIENKDAKPHENAPANRSSIELSENQEQIVATPMTASVQDTFSSYIFTIDGISAMQAASAAHSKTLAHQPPQPAVGGTLQSQDDPVIHVISSLSDDAHSAPHPHAHNSNPHLTSHEAAPRASIKIHAGNDGGHRGFEENLT